jgi:peroxiredoxin
LAEHARRFPELTALGLGLAALSVDPPAASLALVKQLALPFPLLCDTRREVVRSYGLYNAAEKGGIAYPATLVLDRDRTVRFRSLDRTAKRVDLDALYAFLGAGICSAAPECPLCTRIVPSVRDWSRAIGNALRHGIESKPR